MEYFHLWFWPALWVVGVPVVLGVCHAVWGRWLDWDDGELVACILWPLFLLVFGAGAVGLFMAKGTSRLVCAIRKWWEKISRARDCRKNSKIVKGKDGLPRATARTRPHGSAADRGDNTPYSF